MAKNSEHKKAERDRRKAMGFVRAEFWVKPSWLAKIRKFMEGLK